MYILKKKKRKFTKDFQKLSRFLYKEKGIVVKLGETTEFTGHFNRQIIIHHNYDLRHNGLYMLLYESGRVFRPVSSNLVDKNTHPAEYLTSEVLEEIKIWGIGRRIAKNLDIRIDDDKWKRHRENGIVKILKEKK